MPQMKLTAYAELKGWTKQNLTAKLQRGIITQRCLVKNDKGMNVGIISELADEDNRKNGNEFKAAMYKTKVIGDKLGSKQSEDETDWLGDALDEETDAQEFTNEVLSKTKPKAIPKPKKETRQIDGKETPVTVVPTADSDPYERFRGAKTNKEELSARKLELEVAEMEGRVLDTEEVRTRIIKLVGQTKDYLTNLPGKLAPLLIGITDVVEMETTLMKEINLTCDSLTKLGQTDWANNEVEE